MRYFQWFVTWGVRFGCFAGRAQCARFVFVLAVVVGKRQDTFVGRMQNQTNAWNESMNLCPSWVQHKCRSNRRTNGCRWAQIWLRCLAWRRGLPPHKQPMQSGWTPLARKAILPYNQLKTFFGDSFPSKAHCSRCQRVVTLWDKAKLELQWCGSNWSTN